MSDEQYGADWLTTGGIDGEWVTIRNPKFECFVESQDPTQPFLVLDLIPDDPETSPVEEKRFGIGKGWQETDDGAEVTRTDGGRVQFHTSSKAGRLLHSFLENGGAAKARDKAKAGDSTTPFQAAWWDGLHFLIEEKTASFNDRDTGENVEFSYFVAAETDGWADGGKKKAVTKKAAAKKVAKKAAAKKAAAKPEPEPEPDDEGTDEPPEPETPTAGGGSDLEAQVREHCANTSVDTHDEWMMEVYADIPDVAYDETVSGLVDDEGAIWADTWSD